MKVGAILLAAGRSERFTSSLAETESAPTSGTSLTDLASNPQVDSKVPQDKVYQPLSGRPVLLHALKGLLESPRVGCVVLVTRQEATSFCRSLLSALPDAMTSRIAAIVPGGKERVDSVEAGLAALPNDIDTVLVHDAARPLATSGIVERLLGGLHAGVDGVIPVLPVDDTIKRVEGSRVTETLPRAELRSVQTPQAFFRSALESAYRWFRDELRRTEDPQGFAKRFTDDASLLEAIGRRVDVVPGEVENRKITRVEDLSWMNHLLERRQDMRLRVGEGFDAHRLVVGRPLILGGVHIPFEKGLEGHSDGDVLTHVITDALLGAAMLGDLGAHFSGRTAEAGIRSLLLLEQVVEWVDRAGWRLLSVDSTVIAERPKLSPYRLPMAERLGEVLRLPAAEVSVKATSTDGLGFTGRGEGIAAKAVVLLQAK